MWGITLGGGEGDLHVGGNIGGAYMWGGGGGHVVEQVWYLPQVFLSHKGCLPACRCFVVHRPGDW